MGKEGVHKELALPLSTLSLAKLILARVVEALRAGHARLLSANSLVSGGRVHFSLPLGPCLCGALAGRGAPWWWGS